MKARVLCLSLTLLVAGTMTTTGQTKAQACGIFKTVQFASYGSGCPGAGNLPPILGGSLDSKTCSVTLQLDRYQWLPNVYLRSWTLAVGTQQTKIPILRAGCTLLVQPLVVAVFPNTQTGLSVPLPNDKGLLGLPFYCQAGASYFGFYSGTDLTNGLTIVAR